MLNHLDALEDAQIQLRSTAIKGKSKFNKELVSAPLKTAEREVVESIESNVSTGVAYWKSYRNFLLTQLAEVGIKVATYNDDAFAIAKSREIWTAKKTELEVTQKSNE